MQVQLSKWQTTAWDDPHRFKVIVAGRRVGKTTFSALKMIDFAINNENVNVWYISPTYRQSEQIMWRMMNTLLPKIAIKNKNETKLRLELTNGSIIELKGADTDPDALRGVRIDFLICDEVASFRNWNTVWDEVLRPTLIDSKGAAIFIGTPKGFNEFYALFNKEAEDEDYVSYRFTSYDNPYLPKEEIDKAKQELTEDTFAQEFLGDFRKFTGLAHKQWDRRIHLIEPFDVPKEWQRGRGFDYGSAHFTASVRHAIDNDDNWFIERCYLDNHRDIKSHAEAILAQDYGLGMVLNFGDPSGAQWETEFAQYDLNIQQADKAVGQGSKGWVEFCIEKINERLRPIIGHTVYLPDGRKIENAPRLFVLNTTENQSFVKQIENLKWRETATGDITSVLDETSDPTGGHFDLMACERYFAVSYQKFEENALNDFKEYQQIW